MKRMLAIALAMLMLAACAAAEEEIVQTAFEEYSLSFAELTGETWETEDIEQIRMLAPEEGVSISVCLDVQNVACVTVEYPCGQMTDSVRAAVENLGWLSGEAAAQALALEENEQLEIEDCIVYHVHGESRDAFSICRIRDVQNMLWQPIHGGKKIHDTPRCSGMDVSRMITAEAAALTGWEDCGTCRAQDDQAGENGNVQSSETHS